MSTQIQNKILTKGQGAGGANTNKHGLNYEELTDLQDNIVIIEKLRFACKIYFKDNKDIVYFRTMQSQLFKFKTDCIDINVKKGHGCKKPDECYINEKSKIIFIIEKKFQQVGGSVCEKIQTSEFKLWQYNRTFPNYKVVYIYCLSDWFKYNCQAELEYLKYKNVPVFWGNNLQYKTNIINFINNYK
jgi:hypothetical protein